ncbi:MAG: type III PLP-dependent enzyme [Roseovarius sp.]
MQSTPNWHDPITHLRRTTPDTVQLYFSPSALHATAHRFQAGFPGLVSYAVKANPSAEVLANLAAAGITTFDVASPAEMHAARAVHPRAVLHYNNPVRSPQEVAIAAALNVASYSVDCPAELAKLGQLPAGTEIAVRLALPVAGAAYDFGSKFGVGPQAATALLQQVQAMGLIPAITFHPGTQCADPSAWVSYITTSAQVAKAAGVRLSRLNVGGGFAAHRRGAAPDLEAIFDAILRATQAAFGPNAPALLCEPGRAMVADAFTLATRVKARRPDGTVFLNDGLYGGLAEARDMHMVDRIQVISSTGTVRRGPATACTVFGPTCDSLDRLPDPVPLPDETQPGDYVLFSGMGAYSQAIGTAFNGYGLAPSVTVASGA